MILQSHIKNHHWIFIAGISLPVSWFGLLFPDSKQPEIVLFNLVPLSIKLCKFSVNSSFVGSSTKISAAVHTDLECRSRSFNFDSVSFNLFVWRSRRIPSPSPSQYPASNVTAEPFLIPIIAP